MLAVVGDGTPGWRGRFQREVHIKSTGSRPRGKYTVGAGEAAVAGAVTAARGYCGRATPDKDLVPLRMDKGPHRARRYNQQRAVQCQWQRLFVRTSEWRCGPNAARPSEAPGREAAKGRMRQDQLSWRNWFPVKC